MYFRKGRQTSRRQGKKERMQSNLNTPVGLSVIYSNKESNYKNDIGFLIHLNSLRFRVMTPRGSVDLYLKQLLSLFIDIEDVITMKDRKFYTGNKRKMFYDLSYQFKAGLNLSEKKYNRIIHVSGGSDISISKVGLSILENELKKYIREVSEQHGKVFKDKVRWGKDVNYINQVTSTTVRKRSVKSYDEIVEYCTYSQNVLMVIH